MIWSVVSKAEMKGCTSPTFSFQEEALGKDNIKLAVVDEDDNLNFVDKDDIVLLRTASKALVDTIHKKGVKSTAEDFNTYCLASDKVALTDFLQRNYINVARRYSISDIVDGKEYFVKPRNGSGSKVSLKNICHNKTEVELRTQEIRKQFSQDVIIEDFLPGKEYTVACVLIGNLFYTAPIDINEPFRKLSREEDDDLTELATQTFVQLRLKHHARIDIRSDGIGGFFVIDVNLIPSLGPTDKWTKCFEARSMSYHEALMMAVNSAL